MPQSSTACSPWHCSRNVVNCTFSCFNSSMRVSTCAMCSSIRSLIPPQPSAGTELFDVVGPVCETGDYLALDRNMPEPAAGDLLAVMTAGAYGAVQAGTYNTRALVPEVLVRASEWALVRPRVTAEELIALDRLPPWL